jgi:zinc transport system substrate-binding protein
MVLMNRTLGLVASLALLGSLTACGGSDSAAAPAADSPTEGAASSPEPTATPEEVEPVLEVAAAFYPLEFAVQRIGGDRASVSNITRPGADPHDAELTPREVARLGTADLVVYLSDFQPAVDDAVASVAPETSLDVAEHADLTITASDHGHAHGDEEDDHGHGDEEDEHADDATDPHFWLDPTRYAAVAEAIADRFAALDPEGAQEYSSNAAEFTSELAELDDEFSGVLATCTHRDLVTGHAAFAYLADRYDLNQVGIAGLSPESEPSAAQIRDLVEHVRETGVTTVYAETLVSPALTETIAREAGVQVAVLDPIEGLSDSSAGNDYFEIMRSNLDSLREGQDCS